MPEHDWRPIGQAVEVTADRQLTAQAELERRRAAADAAHEHLWVVAVLYFAAPATLAALAGESDDTAMLDGENIAMPPGVTCWICEEPYSKRVAHRKCRGEPRG